jgi:parallel beta-helix repeat protein
LAVGIILLFIGTSIIPTLAQKIKKSSLPTSKGHWSYVGGNGPGNYTRIQDAIDNSSDRDTIFVFNGTYNENIVIDKAIKLLGDNKNNTIIDGSSGNESIIIIKANEVYIGGFTVRNSSPFYRGIFFRPNCNGVSIIDNIIKNSRGAILLQSSHNTNISRNIIIDNYNNCDIDLINSSDNTICRNVVIHTSGVYPVSISLSANSCNNKIIGNTINKSFYGISVAFSSNYNKIYANSIRNCEWYGIDLYGASYNDVNSNSISDNKWGVFVVWHSDHNNINSNTISNNIYGIRTEETSNSTNNTFYHNNLFNNTINAYVNDGSINNWDNGYPSGGNYWDDYPGMDSFWGENQDINGSDGVGDFSMQIPGGQNQDRYPLIEPYGMTRLSFIPHGGLGISGNIKNVGNTTAFRICWEVTFNGGFVLLGRDTLRLIPKPLVPGEEFTVKSKTILGFGKVTLTMMLWADNAPVIVVKHNGTLLFFFLFIK